MGKTEPLHLRIEGEWSIRNADELLRRFLEALAQSDRLILDFSGVQECDTTTLQLVCSLQNTVARTGQSIQIAAVSPVMQAAAATLGIRIEGSSGL